MAFKSIKVTRGAAFACAVLVAVGGVLVQNANQRNPRIVHGRFSLPAFDAWVYIAMAEHPSVFTAKPWGYRPLGPAIAGRIGRGRPTAGFRTLTLAGMSLAGIALYFYLRRLGFSPWPATAGIAAFVASPPVGEIIGARFLVEPPTVALWILFLWAAQAAAPAGVLAAIAVLGVLSKETFVLLVPHLLFVDPERPWAWRLKRFGIIAAAAMLARQALFQVWPDYTGGAFGPARLLELLRVSALAWRSWLPPLTMGGLLAVAAVGLLRAEGRQFTRDNLYQIAATLALPFAAPLGSALPGFGLSVYGADFRRLSVYALPWVIALALLALGARRRAPPPSPWPRALGAAGLAAAAATIVMTVASLDRYRRADLSGPRDGALTLAACRESLRVARLLEAGRPFSYDFMTQGLESFAAEPARLGEARWFLRDGFGIREEKATGTAVLREPAASLLVPVLTPRDVLLTLVFTAPPQEPIGVSLNGRELGSLSAADANDPAAAAITLPKSALYRGDNVVTLLRGAQQAAAIRKLSLR